MEQLLLSLKFYREDLKTKISEISHGLSEAVSTLGRRNLKTQLYFYGKAYCPYVNLSRKESFSKTLFKREEIKNAGFSF